MGKNIAFLLASLKYQGKNQVRIPALDPTVLILPPRGYWQLSAGAFLNSSLLHVEQGWQALWELLPAVLSDV